MIISNQKRLAADILSRKEGRTVGIHRIWINPDYLDDVTNAVQKDDIRQLIEEGVIRQNPLWATAGEGQEGRAQKPRGEGRGTAQGRNQRQEPKKHRWMKTIRGKALKEIPPHSLLLNTDFSTERQGIYRSVAHLKSNIQLEGIDIVGEA